ncbi:type II CAAX endopeptidase family protein [Clostridium carnis]
MKKSISFLGIYCFVALLLPRMATFLIPNVGDTFNNVFNTFSYLFLAVIAILFFYKDLKENFSSAFNHPFHLIGIALLSFVFILIAGALFALLIKTGEITENQQAVNSFLNSSLISSIIVVLIGPFVEELVFRHIIIGKFKKKIPLWILCIISVLTFALIHIHTFNLSGLIEIRQYIIIGVVMTFLYIKNKSNITYPFIAHILNNLGATLLLYFASNV